MAAKYTFTRPTPAYLSDGTQVAENIPRLEPSQMVYGKAVLVEEGTTNLLQNPSFETGDFTNWYLFTEYGGATYEITSEKAWHGSYSVKITADGTASGNVGIYQSMASATAGVTYTFSVKLAGTLGVNKVFLVFRWKTADNTIIKDDIFYISEAMPQAFKTYSATATAPENTAKMEVHVRIVKGAVGVLYVDAAQLEQKPYATSFIDGTRAAETLTIPTAGVLDPQEGTVEFWVKKSAPNRVTGNCFFATTGTKRWDAWFNAGGKIFGLYNENSGGWLYASISGTFPLNSWQHIAITWNSSGQRLYYNGQLVGVNTSTPIDFGNTIYIGSYKSTSYESNTLIDDLRISSRARSDAEILAAYQGGQPAAVDESTTLKLNFDPFDNADIMIYNDGLVLPFYMQSSRNTKWQLIAPARDDTEEKEAADGDVDFGTTLANSELSLHGIIEYESIQDKNTKKAALAARLNDCRNKKLLALESNPDIGIYVRLKGRPEITEYPSWMDITIPFSTEPFWQSIEEHYRVGSGILTNNGTFETPLTIEIAGPATNPSVVIGSDTLTYTGTINAGQTLVIDTEAKTAKIGSTNALGNYNGVFPTLPPGDTDVTAGSNVTIKWRDRWL